MFVARTMSFNFSRQPSGSNSQTAGHGGHPGKTPTLKTNP
jgi:hypothetical protein